MTAINNLLRQDDYFSRHPQIVTGFLVTVKERWQTLSLTPIPPNASVTTDPSLYPFSLFMYFLFVSVFLTALFSRFQLSFSLHLPSSLIFPFSSSYSLSLCPHLCGVVYAPFIHLCNYECCSLYPHPYDELTDMQGDGWCE